ncbi:MAG: class D sortase [Firmicutes bacterium]|nr:class D sortase [Alicyclobacillaceae bacterium]MCL6496096.1 class D sortase [Bacillota bacterium]
MTARYARWLGFLLVALGLAALAAPLGVRAWAAWQQRRLVNAAQPLPPLSPPDPASAAPVPAPATPAPALGAVVARLEIPVLKLSAVVVAGTNEALLAAAPGWVTTTALPGQAGTAVIAAHNATFFRHLDRLRPGDTIAVATAQGAFRFQVTGSRIVRAGAPLRNTVRPSLALEACYPLDALYLTPWRYVVTARLVQSRLTSTVLPGLPGSGPYAAAIPPAVAQRFDLSLNDNPMLMGTLRYQGGQSHALAFEESSTAYTVIAQALRLFFAANHLSAVRDLAAWRAMTPPGTALPPYWGFLPKTAGPANVTVTLDKEGRPLAVSLKVHGVTWNGGPPQTVAVTVSVRGHRLELASITTASA